MRRIRTVHHLPLLASLTLVFAGACGGDTGSMDGEADMQPGESAQEAEPIRLGPADGHDLPATELERVALGSVAPDFSLQTIAGDTVTLSSFRGQKDVILVFYRGHW